jgi:TatA/E family protein of Tat protein translocase
VFGTLGFSELILILVIVLIIFGAGRLPQIGEGIGKALKGFKKEVNEPPPPLDPNAPNAPGAANAPAPAVAGAPAGGPVNMEEAKVVTPPSGVLQPTAPYTPGPELTPGTTAALMAQAGPQPPAAPKPRVAAQTGGAPAATAQGQSGPTMEERAANPAPPPRAAYPPVPPAAKPQPVAKRPSAIVNKDAVARVQAQQAALKANAAQKAPAQAGQSGGPTSQDMQSLGEGLGDALRTFRSAVADVRNTIDPEMRTIRAEMDAAQKELEQSIEAAKEIPAVQEDPPKNA